MALGKGQLTTQGGESCSPQGPRRIRGYRHRGESNTRRVNMNAIRNTKRSPDACFGNSWRGTHASATIDWRKVLSPEPSAATPCPSIPPPFNEAPEVPDACLLSQPLNGGPASTLRFLGKLGRVGMQVAAFGGRCLFLFLLPNEDARHTTCR